MRASSWRVVAGALIAWCIAGCAAPSAEADREPDIRVIPISSNVRPIKAGDDDLDWETVVHAHLAGEPVFDSVFRRPSGPVNSVPVFCDRARSVGVYIEVKSRMSREPAIRPLRFSWWHAAIDPDKPIRNEYEPAWILPQVQGVLIYSDRLALDESRRVDGEWVVTVHHLGEEIYREEFMLMDCDDSYAPGWYERGTN